jgi:RimJ/RimL family protein N-acetyltransferase
MAVVGDNRRQTGTTPKQPCRYDGTARMNHRPITEGDLDVLHLLYMDPENNPFLSYDPMDKNAFRPIFEDLVRSGNTHLLWEGTDVVGTFALRVQTHRSAHVATLGSFAMHPDFRGRGFGAKAISKIVEVARAKGVRRLELLVETDNARAIRFYEKQGFVKEGILRGAFRRANDANDIDELSMSRRL